MIRINTDILLSRIDVRGANDYELEWLIKACLKELKRKWSDSYNEVLHDVLKITDEELVDLLRRRGYFVKRSNVDW